MFNDPILNMEISIVYRCFILLLLCICLSCLPCREEERNALLQIKTSINSPDGTAFSSWYEQDCCQWEGVECNPSTNRVSRIFFHHQRDPSLLENWYPNATLFAQFKDLEILELPGNHIVGFSSPEELQNLKHLQRLILHDNLIANAYHICWGKGALPSLSYLDLSANKLKGFIPECLCYSQSLTHLVLSHNEIHGISSCLSNMTSLEHLDLSNNLFNGSFPSFLAHKLASIDTLILSKNDFKGKVSFSIFANLSRLTWLDISYNTHLELETESQTWVPSFNFTGLNLAGCSLQKFPGFLSTQNNLKFLDLSDNFLVGNVPSWIIHNTTSHLWLRNNNLSGSFLKTFQNISSQLTSLDISNNSFNGPLPEDIHLDLVYLGASDNDFYGGIPPSFGRLKRLQFLDLSGNKLQGEIHNLLTSNMSSLEYLYLHDNKLRGDTVPRNSSLPKLKILELSNNEFSGIFLDSLLRSLSKTPAPSQLRMLILRGNHLEGQIPQQLCQMTHLYLLDLSKNNLSGELPDCIDNITSLTGDFNIMGDITSWTGDFNIKGDITSLTGRRDIKITTKGNEYINRSPPIFAALDISCNRLTGSLPVQITQLTAIRLLNLSNNLLTAQIPVSLANLTQLEALDLSHNNLFGELSPDLTTLAFLAVFDVSFNNLSGAIPPQKGQFGTFDSDSYIGNPGLCGMPLSRKCGVEPSVPVPQKPSYANSASSQIRPLCTIICSFLVLVVVLIFFFV